MIIHKEENGETHYKYISPSKDEMYLQISKFDELIYQFISYHEDLDEKTFLVDYGAIGCILVRIDQRKEKFKIFHDDTIMNEMKEVALWAYWIIKMKPFKIIQADMLKKYRYINENFATFLILSVLKEEANRNNQTFELSEEYSHKLMYSLKFWSLSIDSFISMVEALNECPRQTMKKTRNKQNV